MKIVMRNKRTPRKYTEMNSLSLCDDRGMVWASISVSNRGISISHLDGARVTTHLMNGLGDWDLDNEFNRPWRSTFSCPSPTCRESDKVYDPQYHVVKCKHCGEVYK